MLLEVQRGNTSDVPPFISMRGMTPGTEPGYLGVAHRAFTPSGPAIENLRLASGLTQERVDERRDLLNELDDMRREMGDDAQEFFRIWWKERLRAARRVFNDPEQVEQIVALLEAAGGPG